jgi:sialic acid synthase SpsE
VVQAAAEIGQPKPEASSASTGDTPQPAEPAQAEPAASPVSEAEQDAKVPFHDHPRWKQVLEERKTLRERAAALAPLAERMQNVETFMQQNGLAAEEAARGRRRSLYIVTDLKAGDRLCAENVRAIRPGSGLPPKHLDQILDRRVKRDVARGTPLSWDLIG